MIGVAFLAAAVTLAGLVSRALGESRSRPSSESIVIGGWVAMWRPLEIFLSIGGRFSRRESCTIA